MFWLKLGGKTELFRYKADPVHYKGTQALPVDAIAAISDLCVAYS